MKFIKLTYDQSGRNVWVNPERISYIEKFDQTRYLHFGNTDDYIVVKETVKEIEDLINGQTV